jgi:pilus assembly protein CpaB
MKPARLIILSVAAVAAGLAGYLALNMSGGQKVVEIQAAMPRTIKEATIDVLVAKTNLSTGSRLSEESMTWIPWPEGAIAPGFITKKNRETAMADLNGAIVRLPIFANEPVRLEKIVDASNRTMSSILPAGKRAIATEISVSTGAGGFILPNDRVDVIMVKKGQQNTFTTETVLSNIRVLAIDQQLQQGPDGKQTAVGSTATLELTPDQAKVIAVAQQIADRLTLALRSVADSGEPDTSLSEHLLGGNDGSPGIQVIKSGNISTSQ